MAYYTSTHIYLYVYPGWNNPTIWYHAIMYEEKKNVIIILIKTSCICVD